MKRASLALLVLALGAAACSRGEAAPPPLPAPAPVAAAPAAAAPVAPMASSHAPAVPAAPSAAPGQAGARPASGALPRLVFFMNPHGRPCQMQDRILREMSGQLAGHAEVVYVKTTEPADLPAFEHYGIRALPMLLLADAQGMEIRRAAPGIQSAPQVLQLLAP